MIRQDILRVATAALALSALSFAAGIAGDLSHPQPANAGVRVVLRIPPEIPASASAQAATPSVEESADRAPANQENGEEA